MGTILKNRKARFEYHVEETFTAGIMLEGYEVKPVKAGKCSIAEAHCYFQDDGLYLKGMTLSESVSGDISRTKKLLLNKKELIKLESRVQEKGLTIIPLSLFTKKALIKLEIGLCKGKKLYDKRESIKARDVERQENRDL